jgi:VWFA-related protein
VVAALLFPVPVPVAAQTPPAAPEDEFFGAAVHVSIVNVDVYVTDKDGNPVTGLTETDFEVFDDGQPVEITNFYAVEDGRPAAPAAAPAPAAAEPALPPGVEPEEETPPEQKLRLVVFVDNFNSMPLERNRVIPDLRRFLLELDDDDEVLLVTYDRALNVRVPFTGDHNRIADALLELKDLTGFRTAKESQRREAIRGIEKAEGLSEAMMFAVNYAEAETLEVRETIEALRELLDSFAGLPGRKAMLHVSSGIPMVAGQELFEAVDVRFDDSRAFMEMARYDVSRDYHGLAAQANAHRVSFYTLDAGGLRPDTFGGAEYTAIRSPGTRSRINSAAEASHQSSLRYLAERTGGRAIVNRNEVFPVLHEIGEALQTYYSLGYPERQAVEGRYHSIKVEVKRPGVQVRHRDGYRSRSINERMIDRVRTALSYTFVDNPLGVEARPGEVLRRDRNEYLVPVQVRIPLENVVLLPRADGKHEARLRLFVAAIDDQGRASGIEEVPIGFRLPAEHADAARKESYIHTHRLLMREGLQKVAIGVLDEFGAMHSVVSLPVRVGAAVRVPAEMLE